MGMVRFTIHLAEQNIDGNPNRNYVQELESLINKEDIYKAIETNDFKLAYENFKKIEDFIYNNFERVFWVIILLISIYFFKN